MDIVFKRFSQIQVNNDLYDYFLLLPLDYNFLEIRAHIYFIHKLNAGLSHDNR